MDEQKINNLIDKKLREYDAANRFRLAPNNRHVHNNVDAPFVYTPYAFFIGKIFSNGLTSEPFPKGWTVENDTTGSYIVTHNLGPDVQYNVMVTPQINPLIASYPCCGVTVSDDVFQVLIFDSALQTPLDNTFYFTLSVVNNKSDTFPNYS